MPDTEKEIKKRVLELADKSYRNNQYLFTAFLNQAEYSEAVAALQQNQYYNYDSFGGSELAERMVLRFGTLEEFGYVEEFPVSCIEIKPVLAKFADKLTHRDFLGSVLNLGIERNVIGDIFIRENTGYMICLSHMAEYIAQNLTKIKHTAVKCRVTQEMQEALKPVLEPHTLSVASQRCDMVIAKLYQISRSEAVDLFRGKKVCINSRLEESNSKNLKEGDIVSVRGYGKFSYQGVQASRKKDKLRVTVNKYI